MGGGGGVDAGNREQNVQVREWSKHFIYTS